MKLEDFPELNEGDIILINSRVIGSREPHSFVGYYNSLVESTDTKVTKYTLFLAHYLSVMKSGKLRIPKVTKSHSALPLEKILSIKVISSYAPQ